MSSEVNDAHTTASTTYHLSPGVKWVVETHGLILTNGKETVRHVFYPEAAIWDLISRGYRLHKIIPMMCAIASLQTEQAEQLVLKTLEEWATVGFLTRENNDG